MSTFKRSLVAIVLLLAAACASASGPRSAGASGTRDVITEAELQEFGAQPLRQAIQRLRPQFLRTRGPSSITMQSADVIVVYMGNTRMGGLEVLDQITTSDVREVRYMSPTDATQRFGINHTSGAIILVPR